MNRRTKFRAGVHSRAKSVPFTAFTVGVSCFVEEVEEDRDRRKRWFFLSEPLTFGGEVEVPTEEIAAAPNNSNRSSIVEAEEVRHHLIFFFLFSL
jgi:hypothetical protein